MNNNNLNLGRADPVGEHESICYAQKAFMMDEKRHYELMDVARREKVCNWIWTSSLLNFSIKASNYAVKRMSFQLFHSFYIL